MLTPTTVAENSRKLLLLHKCEKLKELIWERGGVRGRMVHGTRIEKAQVVRGQIESAG